MSQNPYVMNQIAQGFDFNPGGAFVKGQQDKMGMIAAQYQQQVAQMQMAQAQQQQQQAAELHGLRMQGGLVQVRGPDGQPTYAREADAVGLEASSMASNAKPPASIEEYQLAVSQGYPGTFESWTRQRNQRFSTQDIGGVPHLVDNVGMMPPRPMSTIDEEVAARFGLARGGESGKLDAQFEADAPQREAKAKADSIIAQTVYEDVDRALGFLDRFGQGAAGFGGAATSWIPNTPAARLKDQLDSIKGNVGIDSLLRIKATGAGLGHIPQAQLDLLSRLIGELRENMNPGDLRYNLLRVQELYEDIVTKTGGDPREVYDARVERAQGQGNVRRPQPAPETEDPLGLR